MVILMKSVLIGGLAALVIAIAAGAVLNNMNPTTGQKSASESVRLN
jgi:hypothetical protein